MNLNQKYTLCRGVQWQVVENEAIIVNIDNGDYFNLNNSGTKIFLSIVNGKPLTSVVSLQKETHAKSEAELKKDIIDLLQDLVKNKIIKKAS